MAAPVQPKRPGLLVVLDGFSFGDPANVCNAFALARTPTFDRLRRECPVTMLECGGERVGLPPGQMGNSEVGHLNIGAGRVVYQDFMRINNAVRDGTFGQEPAFQEAFAHVRRTGGRLHLMGLLGPGGVHAHEAHFGAALQAAAKAGLKDVFVHPVGDGRDTPPSSAAGYLQTLERQIAEAGVGRVATLVGRYYAMDRDNRWERTKEAYDLYTQGTGRPARNARDALVLAAFNKETDEFVRPTLVDPAGLVRPGDAVCWLNFRPDRSRQVTRAFMDPAFDRFPRGRLEDVLWVCMTQYDKSFEGWPGLRVAYGQQAVPDCLAEHVSRLGLSQFHAAETEKYAHVTYFLNGGREAPFPGEARKLVPSPKVATYDLQPEMSAGPLTDEILLAMGSGGHDLVVVNYANPDMVGHTGKLEPTVQAVEFVDNCVNRLVSVATELGFVTLITADHGNCEEMCKVVDGRRGEPITKHTLNPVPLIVANGGPGLRLRDGGALENVAPTLLDLMGLPKPAAMTAESLVAR
jgi:2,3-bisphosphoglycerate-independent phosphoglycerate mutase